MKPREFWIVKREDGETTLFEDYFEHAKDFTEFYPGEIVHVREVSPKLDAAIQNIVDALRLIEDLYVDSVQDAPKIAKEALAALKNARGSYE